MLAMRAARPAFATPLRGYGTVAIPRLYRNMTTRPVPIVVLGRTKEVGTMVIEAMKPEYEVIHFFKSASAASSQMPRLFAGKQPSEPSHENLGTQDYSRRPEAVVLGGWFTDSMVEALRKECDGAVSAPWIARGVTEQQRDEMLKQPPDPATYGPFVAKAIKGVMARVKEKGRWEMDGVYTYGPRSSA